MLLKYKRVRKIDWGKFKYRMRKIKNAYLIKYYRIEGKIKYPLIYSLNNFIRLIEIGIIMVIALTIL